ncbi:MAG: GxxExxY protein [Sedimentisphaerales bacterium]|nr:GxxExxY protein [Sedimentisphaerales bacterium]
MRALKHSELSQKIIAAAHNVHKELGQGFLEKVYKNALAIELREMGLTCDLEVPMSVSYRGHVVGDYVADMIVDGKIIVEVKAVAELSSVHEVQLVNYLKATDLQVGLLINFGRSVKVKRRVFGYDNAEREDWK